MLPGSLQAGRADLLVSPRATPQRVAALGAAVRGILHIVRVWFARVESRRALAMMSDHVLRDIGLTRHDVERELLKSFWRE